MTSPNLAHTVRDLLSAGDEHARAISTPGAIPLTYGGLRSLVSRIGSVLNSNGIGRNDRVAIVLGNGPEAATAFLATASAATAAPLNPAYRAEEFKFYLADLQPRILIVDRSLDSPAVQVAIALGIPVVYLESTPDAGAGSFTLTFPPERNVGSPVRNSPGADDISPGADDIALVLHTSGTTSRPKIVPLTQRNVVTSARNVRTSTALGASDRGLNIMPLFHIHGLIAGVLAPLSAGGEVCCTSGFNALKFFAWMQEMHPTWYTAVPTMHQAIVARAPKNLQIIAANPLRFIRSSSASLAPQIIRELESTFHAPVIEAYGMTEAAHQMTCNPLPPGVRKPGTVGIAAGPEVAVIDANAEIVPLGMSGEVAIRGENVISGYENNPQANDEAFSKGWFRTGDQGIMDAAGYLTITGRLKEIINRGGEKISPREIDEILLDHPGIAQCVTFGVPHEKLGETVAAAVILKESITISEGDLRDFVASRVAPFKVPSRILILADIPKGPTGKVQRIGLAAKLGLT